uniref:SHSP domain-containing protein n=1 Tax=Strongyloides venezuelensis TaxID=75913 RepID=A0A0K0EW55_STRVS
MSQQGKNLNKVGSTPGKDKASKDTKNHDQIVCDWPLASNSDDIVKSTNHDGKFELVLDCHEFDPKDVMVFAKDDKVNIYCDHQKRRDSNTCERKVSRTYKLPSDVNPSTLKHSFSTDGDLIITADRK